MTESATYCIGITVNGNPCRNKVRDGLYCRYHKSQEGQGGQSRNNAQTVTIPGSFMNSEEQKSQRRRSYISKPLPQPNPRRPGYIYIYTYERLFESIVTGSTKELTWLKLDNSVLTHQKNDTRLEWTNTNEILCKIGMTTKANVQLRLNEWEKSCSFKIVNLTMDNVNILLRSTANLDKRSGSLSKLMSRLSLNKNSKKLHHTGNTPHKNIQLRSYKNGGYYNDGKGKMTLQDIENSLHQLFWKKYGKGIVHCSGCNQTGEAYKRHIEWFLIPIKDLPNVLETIDNFCYA